jgi:hypothetical protein
MARLKWLAPAVALVALCCGGSQHRKVQGPPPEYEVPEEPAKSAATSQPDAAAAPAPSRPSPRDAGAQ